ncbi:MAG: sulfite oxidase heme-binding subunit YedZ [Candidatus Binatia bacterium]
MSRFTTAAVLSIPFFVLIGDLFLGNLGANPIEEITHRTGLCALLSLLATLAISPLRRIARLRRVARYRRALGLSTFFYASLHALTYFVLDLGMDPAGIVEDLTERRFAIAGILAYLLLIPLAVTSNAAAVRGLGGRRWRGLHRLVYLVAVLVPLHYLWLSKGEQLPPYLYASAFVVLLGLRVIQGLRLS